MKTKEIFREPSFSDWLAEEERKLDRELEALAEQREEEIRVAERKFRAGRDRPVRVF